MKKEFNKYLKIIKRIRFFIILNESKTHCIYMTGESIKNK